jgi:hypothetical protein
LVENHRHLADLDLPLASWRLAAKRWLGLFGSFAAGPFRTAKIGVIRSIGLTLLK